MNEHVIRLVGIVTIGFLLILAPSGNASVTAFDLPEPPAGGRTAIYYRVSIPDSWAGKLNKIDQLRNVRNAMPYLSSEGVRFSSGEFALFFPDIGCLIVGAAARTQDQIVFLLE